MVPETQNVKANTEPDLKITAKLSNNDSANTAILSRFFPSQSEKILPVFSMFSYKDPRFFIALNINNEKILGLIDSGSTKTYVCGKTASLLGKFEPTDLKMKSANNNTVKIDGIKTVHFNLRNTSHDIPTRCIETLKYECIIGIDFLKKFELWVDFGSGTCGFQGGVRGKWTSPRNLRDSRVQFQISFTRLTRKLIPGYS